MPEIVVPTIIGGTLVAVCVMLILRNICYWYWRINERVLLLEKIHAQLALLTGKSEAVERTVWDCPKCQKRNDGVATSCDRCGYRRMVQAKT